MERRRQPLWLQNLLAEARLRPQSKQGCDLALRAHWQQLWEPLTGSSYGSRSLAAAMGAESPGDLSEGDEGEVLTVFQLDLPG